MPSANPGRALKRQSAYWRRRKLIQNSGLPEADQRLLDHVSNIVGEREHAWFSMRYLGDRCKRSEETVRKRLKKLVNAGIVCRKRREDRRETEGRYYHWIDEMKLRSLASGEGSGSLFGEGEPASGTNACDDTPSVIPIHTEHRSKPAAPSGHDRPVPPVETDRSYRSRLAGATGRNRPVPYKDHPPKEKPKESPHTQAQEGVCVREIEKFFRVWSGADDYKPTQHEIDFMLGFLTKYGEEQFVEAMKHAPAELRVSWPKASTIFAVKHLWHACLGRAKRARRNLRISALFQSAMTAAEDGEVFQPTNDQDKNLLAEGSRLWEQSSPSLKNASAQALVAVNPALKDLDWHGPILQPLLWARLLARNAQCEELGSGS